MKLLRPYGPSPDQVAQGAQEMAMEEKLELHHGVLKCIMVCPFIFMHFLEAGTLAAENCVYTFRADCCFQQVKL